MLRSLVSGFSGLKTHVSGMDVVGNNIANVNTIGYKQGRATFKDLLSQTLSGATSSTSTLSGGKNPVQIGLGAALSTVDTIFSQGGLDSTNNQNDLAINGEGFFTVRRGEELLYTRAGNFSFDVNGKFVTPDGFFVQGWMDKDTAGGGVRTSGPVTDVNLPQGMSISPRPTSLVEISGNMNSSASIGATHTISMETFDSQGEKGTISLVLDKTATNTWDWHVSAPASSGTAIGSGTLTFDAFGKLNIPQNIQLTYNPVTGGSAGQVITVDILGGTSSNNSGLTQTSSRISIGLSNLAQNGYTMGNLQSYLVDFNGTIRAFFDNGQTMEVARIALTTFTNQAGLMRLGNNLFAPTANSGAGNRGEAGTGNRGEIQPSSLEFSNVDLAAQFTKMIILQRGFQANAKVITASDEMLQALMTLKR